MDTSEHGSEVPQTAVKAAPGWYSIPGVEGQRYWNGTAWTKHTTQMPNSYVGEVPKKRHGVAVGPWSEWTVWAPFGCAVVLVLGSLGPWVDSVLITVSGMSGDGVITFVCGLLALVVLGLRRRRNARGTDRTVVILGVLLGLAAAATAIYDLSQIYGAETDVFGKNIQIASPGWGVWLAALGGVGLIASVVAADRALAR